MLLSETGASANDLYIEAGKCHIVFGRCGCCLENIDVSVALIGKTGHPSQVVLHDQQLLPTSPFHEIILCKQ